MPAVVGMLKTPRRRKGDKLFGSGFAAAREADRPLLGNHGNISTTGELYGQHQGIIHSGRLGNRRPQWSRGGRGPFRFGQSIGPKAMGGPGRPNTTTPEHLFAVGYAACFVAHSILLRSRRRRTPRAQPSPAACRSGRATRRIRHRSEAARKDATLPQAELEALAREAHEKICPYSHATRNNVPVELSVRAGSRHSLRSSAAIVR